MSAVPVVVVQPVGPEHHEQHAGPAHGEHAGLGGAQEAGCEPHPEWCGSSAPDEPEADVDDVDQQEDGNRGQWTRHAEQRQDRVDGQSPPQQEQERAHQAKGQPLGD